MFHKNHESIGSWATISTSIVATIVVLIVWDRAARHLAPTSFTGVPPPIHTIAINACFAAIWNCEPLQDYIVRGGRVLVAIIPYIAVAHAVVLIATRRHRVIAIAMNVLLALSLFRCAVAKRRDGGNGNDGECLEFVSLLDVYMLCGTPWVMSQSWAQGGFGTPADVWSVAVTWQFTFCFEAFVALVGKKFTNSQHDVGIFLMLIFFTKSLWANVMK
eukprot:PhF_6_TR40889/c1_g1_i1/m.61835